MSNKEILEKAIQKAIDGGWNYKKSLGHAENVEFMVSSGKSSPRDVSELEYLSSHTDTRDIIYNHDFAKALWGESKATATQESPTRIRLGYDLGWKRHLQNMVVADDPIAYLGENI